MRRLVLLAGLLALAAACDPVLEVTAEIEVPVDVQQSVGFPVQVAFQTEVHDGASRTICEPSEEPITVILEDTEIGCAEPLEVQAVLGPWTPPETGCVVEPGNSFSSVSDDALARATATAFAEYEGTSCQGAVETVSLVLE